MKHLFSTLAILILYNSLFAQDDVKQFTRKTNAVTVYKDGEWGEQAQGHNTFIINCNSDGDILWLTAQGQAQYFKRTGNAKSEKTKQGVKYQSVATKDSKGFKVTIWLMDDKDRGIMMIYPGEELFMIHFFNSDDYEENE